MGLVEHLEKVGFEACFADTAKAAMTAFAENDRLRKILTPAGRRVTAWTIWNALMLGEMGK